MKLCRGNSLKYIILTGAVSGTVHEEYIPFIKEMDSKGICVFIVPENSGRDKGDKSPSSLEIVYASQIDLINAGAIILTTDIKNAHQIPETVTKVYIPGMSARELGRVVSGKINNPAVQAVIQRVHNHLPAA